MGQISVKDLRGNFKIENDSILKITSQLFLSSHSTFKKINIFKLWESYARQMIEVHSKKNLNLRPWSHIKRLVNK